MTYGNCWSYAVPRWLKSPRTSYLIVRLSKHSWWPHVFFCRSIKDTQVEEFKPLVPQKGIATLWRALWFKGRVRKGRGEE